MIKKKRRLTTFWSNQQFVNAVLFGSWIHSETSSSFFIHIMSHESTQRNSVLMLSVTSSEQKKVSSDTKLLSLLINTLMEKQIVFWKSMVN